MAPPHRSPTSPIVWVLLGAVLALGAAVAVLLLTGAGGETDRPAATTTVSTSFPTTTTAATSSPASSTATARPPTTTSTSTTATTATTTTTTTAPAPSTTVAPGPGTAPAEVVAGVFNERANAERQVERLQADGFEGFAMVDAGGPPYPVIRSGLTLAEAQDLVTALGDAGIEARARPAT
ncbi:MAG: SPOR domain-containing protein [Acidimicrobiales bacterium]|nr:SPOR domain-containing protein [Acidimicrobiales bacterium]